MNIIVSNIKLQNVRKSFGDKVVFDGFDLDIQAGMYTVIMGTSGSGKTTLLRLIAGLDTPDSGLIGGVPQKSSILFQEDRLCEHLTALENVELVLGHADKKTRSENRKTIMDHFARTGLDLSAHENSPVSELSGGMKRRVALVRAMIFNSSIVLLDEPCKGLDEATKELCLKYIKKERRGRTMIIVTHDETEAEFFGVTPVRL